MTIFDFITAEKNAFTTNRIQLSEGWEWSFFQHVRISTLYKNSKFSEGDNDGNRPFKNIVRPMLNLQYQTEGFDVKDVQLFVDDAENYYKSFLIRKYHEKWAYKNKMDTFLDELIESWIDYGGALIKKTKGVRPEVVPLRRLAFCDQTDLLAGPICEAHYFSPDEILKMKGWQNVDEVITLANKMRTNDRGTRQNQTPGKYIEVFELHGMFPNDWLENEDDEMNESLSDEQAEQQLSRQMHIVSFYKDDYGNQKGISLFSVKESESPYRLLLRDPIYGRALGLGGIEELFDAQMWTNYDAIRMQEMLDAASKIILQTTDPAVAARHPSGLRDLDNLEVVVVADNKRLEQVQTAPVNLPAFERAAAEWESNAHDIAGASDALMGAGGSRVNYRAMMLAYQLAQQLHSYRQGKIATFVEELYREWFLPDIARSITNGTTFLATLSVDELKQVGEAVTNCELNDWKKNLTLSGKTWTQQEEVQQKQNIQESFQKSGNKHFIEILQGEFKDISLDLEISIKNKQVDTGGMLEVITKVVGLIVQTQGQILQNPVMAKLFNQMLEYSGLEPLDFSGMDAQDKNIPQQTPKLPIQPQQPNNNIPVPQTVTATV